MSTQTIGDTQKSKMEKLNFISRLVITDESIELENGADLNN